MSPEDQAYIDKVARELSLAQHQAKNSEWSNLIAGVRRDIKALRHETELQHQVTREAWAKLEEKVDKLEEVVIPNARAWNEGVAKQKWIERAVYSAIIVAALTAIGLAT